MTGTTRSRTPTGTLALVVGDVMGRGVSAATTMIRVRAGIRGLLTVDPGPPAVLTAADEMVARDAPDQFVTAAAVLVDPTTGRDLPVQRRSRPARRGPPGRPHRGAEDDEPASRSVCPAGSHRTVETAHLEPGTLLVLVTDGVVESRTDDLDQGITRLRDRAVELRGRPLRELVDSLAELADTSLRDDVTVVAARLR